MWIGVVYVVGWWLRLLWSFRYFGCWGVLWYGCGFVFWLCIVFCWLDVGFVVGFCGRLGNGLF